MNTKDFIVIDNTINKKDDNSLYLTDIPQEVEKHGLCKTLMVRREVIHYKHIMTEIFVRKSIDINKYLDYLEMSLFDYMEILTNKIRRVHHISRDYRNDFNKIVKTESDSFTKMIDLCDGFKRVIVFDFDGVITDKSFRRLYEMFNSKYGISVCTANPTVTEEWFERKELSKPNNIYSNKGKLKKIRKLIDLSKTNDYVFFVDNEKEYLEFAWLFGIKTFLWDGNKIKHFSMKTR